MVSGTSVYHVVEAMVPLYVAMALGYTSVRLRTFTAEQCAGINHFTALFALPLLIFRMISSNDPYAMELRFVLADALQKVVVLAALAVWARLSARGSIAWVITLFSLATLPNTIIMGVPILRGMYGPSTESLMVQVVVFQFVIWYMIVVFLFQYMAAKDSFAREQLSRSNSMVVPVSDGDRSVPVDIERPNAQVVPASSTPPPAAAAAPSIRCILLMAAKRILQVPSTYGAVLGLVWSFIAFRLHIKLPKIVDNSVLIISETAVGLAMFSVGTFMARQKRFIACGYSVATMATAIRFLVGPAVMATTSLAIGLRGQLLHVGIVQAALPLAVISFVYAEEYNVHPEIMSTSVIVGIFISVPITLIYYIALG